MENYTVFIVTIKELLLSGQFWKIAMTLIGLVIAWRLPDVIKAGAEVLKLMQRPDQK